MISIIKVLKQSKEEHNDGVVVKAFSNEDEDEIESITKENIEELNSLIDEYETETKTVMDIELYEQQPIQLEDKNLLSDHPELYFSLKKIKEINILKFIAKTKISKVNLFFFILFNFKNINYNLKIRFSPFLEKALQIKFMQ